MLLEEREEDPFCIEWVTGEDECKRILQFLREVDEYFIPSLSSRVNIDEYAIKLSLNAHTLFLKQGLNDVASASVYCNKRDAYLSSIAVKKEFFHQGLGSRLMQETMDHCRREKCRCLRLQVFNNNEKSIDFYTRCGLMIEKNSADFTYMMTEL